MFFLSPPHTKPFNKKKQPLFNGHLGYLSMKMIPRCILSGSGGSVGDHDYKSQLMGHKIPTRVLGKRQSEDW